MISDVLCYRTNHETNVGFEVKVEYIGTAQNGAIIVNGFTSESTQMFRHKGFIVGLESDISDMSSL